MMDWDDEAEFRRRQIHALRALASAVKTLATVLTVLALIEALTLLLTYFS